MRRFRSALALLFAVGLAAPSLAVNLKPTFDELDANKDGSLSKSEVVAVKGLDFAKADANKDGKLSRPEYASAIG